MKLSFTPVHKMRPCIFLSAFLLCILVTGYYDQANDSTACQGYGYFNLNDDSNDLDLQKQRIRHSAPGINCIVFHGVHEGHCISNSIRKTNQYNFVQYYLPMPIAHLPKSHLKYTK